MELLSAEVVASRRVAQVLVHRDAVEEQRHRRLEVVVLRQLTTRDQLEVAGVDVRAQVRRIGVLQERHERLPHRVDREDVAHGRSDDAVAARMASTKPWGETSPNGDVCGRSSYKNVPRPSPATASTLICG